MTTLLLIPTRIESEGLALTGTGAVDIRVCGMGPLAAAVAAARWLGESGASSCILAGLAGTRDPVRAPVASVVVGTTVRNEAVGCGHAASFHPLSEMAPAGEAVAPDPLSLEVPSSWMRIKAPSDGGGAHGGGIVAGEIGTVAAASGSVEEADGWLARDPGVLVEEMEGYAVALACHEVGVPLSIVRAVSNRAGLRDKSQWQAARALAALRSFLEQAIGGAS